jgi:hypothetical protein
MLEEPVSITMQHIGSVVQDAAKVPARIESPAELDCQQDLAPEAVPGPRTPLNADIISPVAASPGASLRGCQVGSSHLPGAEPELQDIIRDSPFLDLSSPMTAYEWLKMVIMVRTCTAAPMLLSLDTCQHACNLSACVALKPGHSHSLAVSCVSSMLMVQHVFMHSCRQC